MMRDSWLRFEDALLADCPLDPWEADDSLRRGVKADLGRDAYGDWPGFVYDMDRLLVRWLQGLPGTDTDWEALSAELEREMDA